MPTRFYKLTVIGCALSWFLVGLHMPMIHQLIDADHEPHPLGLALLLVFGVLAIGALWSLLRASATWRRSSSSDAGAG